MTTSLGVSTQSYTGPYNMFCALFSIITLLSHVAAVNGCEYDGILYKEGDRVKTQDPCLECICDHRHIQCRLKMCPTLPEPPPPSCHILQRPNTCCPRLLCQNGIKYNAKGRSGLESKLNQHVASNSEGCILNGTVYGEGSAMVTSSLCEYCYCIKGKQHCVRPQCVLSVPGCYPEYNKHSCCPTKYNCSNLNNSTILASTTKVPSSTPSVLTGCEVNGTVYPEGERIEKMENQCEHCYCMKGKVLCDPIVCKVPVNNLCTPVHSNGHCCPTSYNCSTMEDNRHSIPGEFNEVSEKEFIEEITLSSNDTTTEMITFSSDVETTTDILKEINDTEISTVTMETTEFTTVAIFNDTEERISLQNEIMEAENLTGYTENSALEVVTTAATSVEENSTISTNNINNNIKNNNITSPVRSIPDVIEAIINRTLEKDDDYEYDYNESSLPPSLPNLKIIPFVAADAVVNEPDDIYGGKSRTSENPIYFDIPLTNRFSPPAETEGGFMPRDPIIDGPFYETKFEEPFTSGNPGILLEHTSETLLPPITEPPKLFEEGKCQSKGRTYHHGEVVSEPNACELCVCYYGDVHCQKPKCTPLNDGCHRVQDVKNACCGRVVCDSDVKNPLKEEVTPSTFLPESLSNIPAITVADVIVTPNPFKDVIRTEPAPDLIHIMKDMLPHLQETVGLKNDISNNINNIGDLNNITFTISDNITESSITIANETNIKGPTENHTKTEYTLNNTKAEEDYDDTFSFGTVLDLLFNGGLEPNRTKLKSTTVIPLTTEQNKDENKTIKLSNDINQENTESNIVNDKKVMNNKKTNNVNNTEKQNMASVKLNIVNNTMTSMVNSVEKLKPTTEIIPTLTTPNSNITRNQSDISTVPGTPTGLLKLAGCNIYGRMYRVGRIISELSGPCLECMCTEVGVQCKKLTC